MSSDKTGEGWASPPAAVAFFISIVFVAPFWATTDPFVGRALNYVGNALCALVMLVGGLVEAAKWLREQS